MSSSPRRKNGLSPPYSWMQISTWITLPTLLIAFVLFGTPILPIEASIPLTIVALLAGFACGVFGYIACVTDPMDKHLACTLAKDAAMQHHHHHHDHGQCTIIEGGEEEDDANSNNSTKQKTKNNESGGGFLSRFTGYSSGVPQPPEDEPTKYCWVCETDVAEHAMHCKYCNKCVSRFDHHCQWLNTCVGEANYPYFNRTLWSISLFLLIHAGVMLFIIISIFAHPHGATMRRARSWCFDSNVPYVVAGFNIAFLAFEFVALALILQLLIFHIGLQKKRMTTYQYILRENQKKRDKKKAAETRQAKRILAINKAKQEGGSTWALRIGKYISCCDPLRRDEKKETAQQEGA